MTPCGTVGYTAPEIVKDERYSKSVDMWALGCVLYTLLCGFPPFYDESIQVLTEKVARGQYTFLSPWWDGISKSAKDLVSHLLTVDPDKRYTIKEFLAHPWIRQTDEETHAAADAPPLTTPAADQAPYQPTPVEVFDQPGPSAEPRLDFRSPGAVNLREVFDVGYAVHRQEEEGKRRKNFRQGYRGANPTTGFRTALNPLNEDSDDDEEDEEGEIVYYTQDGGEAETVDPPSKIPKSSEEAGDVAAMEAKLRATTLGAGTGTGTGTVTKRHRHHGPRNPKEPFELSLDNATLLERRGRRQQQGQEVA